MVGWIRGKGGPECLVPVMHRRDTHIRIVLVTIRRIPAVKQCAYECNALDSGQLMRSYATTRARFIHVLLDSRSLRFFHYNCFLSQLLSHHICIWRNLSFSGVSLSFSHLFHNHTFSVIYICARQISYVSKNKILEEEKGERIYN